MRPFYVSDKHIFRPHLYFSVQYVEFLHFHQQYSKDKHMPFLLWALSNLVIRKGFMIYVFCQIKSNSGLYTLKCFGIFLNKNCSMTANHYKFSYINVSHCIISILTCMYVLDMISLSTYKKQRHISGLPCHWKDFIVLKLQP